MNRKCFPYLYLFTRHTVPTVFILRSPWLHRTCWARHRKSQRLEISPCDSSSLPLLQRKRKESHSWTAATRGPGVPAVFLQGLQETPHSLGLQQPRERRHILRLGSEPELCCTSCAGTPTPRTEQVLSNDNVNKFMCHKQLKNKKLGLFACKSANYF